MLGAYTIIPDSQPWYYKTVLFVIGFNIAYYPKLKKALSNLFNKTTTILIITVFVSSSVSAKEYKKQINAFKQNFEEKSTELISPFISNELKFDTTPMVNTSAILENIVSKLPKLNSYVLN